MPTPYRQQVTKRPFIGGLLLFILPLPILPSVLSALWGGSYIKFGVGLGAFGLFMLGAYLIRRGLHYQAEQKRRKWARSTRVPWKAIGAGGIGIATALSVLFLTSHSLMAAIFFGIGAIIGCLLTYGVDPQHSSEDVTSKYGVTADEVIEALEEADKKISSIEIAGKSIRNPELNGRLSRITKKARDILGVIEDDPKDLRRARKFLRTYLDGAKRVTEGYAKTHTQQQNDVLDQNFRNVLTTIEDVFGEQHDKLLENNVMDLDVQIEVLETQLKREGVV